MFAAVEGGLVPRALDEHPVPWTSTRGSEDLIAKRTQTRRRRGESITQKHQRMLPPRTLARSTTSCLHFVALRGFWTADHVVKTLELRLGFCLRGPASNGGDLRGASALCGFAKLRSAPGEATRIRTNVKHSENSRAHPSEASEHRIRA